MDAQLRFEITHQSIDRTDTFRPVSDSKNYLRAHFDFLTDDWAGSVTAIFTKNELSYSMLLDENGECLVPWEVLRSAGSLFVSCYCANNNLITTNSAKVYIWESGYVQDGENTQPPTPNLYEQVIASFDSFKSEMREEYKTLDGESFKDWETEE